MSEYDVCVEAAKIQLWVIGTILATHFLYFVTIGWTRGGMPSCRTDTASFLEAAANRFKRGEHRKENDS